MSEIAWIDKVSVVSENPLIENDEEARRTVQLRYYRTDGLRVTEFFLVPDEQKAKRLAEALELAVERTLL